MTFRMLAAATILSIALSAAAQAPATTPAPVEAPQAAVPASFAVPIKPSDATAPAGPAVAKPGSYHTAAFRGGNGATGKIGRDAYGSMGAYGGCRYSGHAGPGGHKLARAC